MKREEIKAIFADATDDQLKAVMDLNGADVEKAKAKVTALEAEVNEKKKAIESLNTEFEALKSSNATAEDYKAKYEAIVAENAAKAAKAEADRVARERAESINNRFNAVIGDKKFTHDAIRDAYAKKFEDALSSKDFEGKSDADIFHELTKDDSTAFAGVSVTRLRGGANKPIGELNESKIRAVMGLPVKE
jgi:chromosome segregation ATPase